MYRRVLSIVPNKELLICEMCSPYSVFACFIFHCFTVSDFVSEGYGVYVYESWLSQSAMMIIAYS